MLSLLKIKNIALIDEIEIEFGAGLNLLTGETGTGKSIIVDALGALVGDRVSADLIKEGKDSARIEGLFSVVIAPLTQMFEESGIEIDSREKTDIIVRRELSVTGKNRIFINNQLVTQNFLKKVGLYFADIHGQGEQAALYDTATHLAMLDTHVGAANLKEKVADAFNNWSAVKAELMALKSDEAEKLQLLDILRFQVNEIRSADPRPGEDMELEDEKRRLNNVEKLSALSEDAYSLLYDNSESTIATLEQAARKID